MTIDDSMRQTFARTGHWHLRGFLNPAQQDDFVAAARRLKIVAPMAHPRMRDGRLMSVRVSSFGASGWWADEQGYRYVERHPGTGDPFPPIPLMVLEATRAALWQAATATPSGQTTHIPPIEAHTTSVDTCLVNLYAPGAQLGWHVDQTERDRVSPIVTFSIGASCTFMLKIEGHTYRYTLNSGDAIVMAGPARLAEHTVVDVRPAEQADLFGLNYNPIATTAPGSRLSFTVRRTGFA